MDQKLAIIQTSYDAEMGYLKRVHEEKCKADAVQLEIRRGELRALIELIEPNAPLADELERFARIELGRLSTALNDALNHVDKMKMEFMELRNDTLNELDIQNQNAAAMKKNRELRSMLNIAETKLKEAIHAAKDIEEELIDAEALMQKAIDLRFVEEKLSPFFFAFQLPSSTKEKAIADRRALSLGLLILSKGSFDEKVTAILNICNNGIPDRWDISTIKHVFHEVIGILQKLHILKVGEGMMSSLEEFLVRCFLELTMYRKEDVVSLFELQQLILFSIVRLPALCKLLQVGTVSPKTASYSAYQIHSMKAVSFLLIGTSSTMSVAHANFFQSLKYRAKLQSSQKRSIHDYALACGANDPYKVDYGAFLSKGMKKSSYRVPPLDNGRDTSLWTHEFSLRVQAVTKIQSVVRSFVARRKFERASLEEAYAEARQSALQLAKSKILKEFQQREAGKGIGKMKWDAEVRIQQAKFRAQGKSLSRSDTVMLMVEAAIAEAQQLVERRFQDILPSALVQASRSLVTSSRKLQRKAAKQQASGPQLSNVVPSLIAREYTACEEYFGFDAGKVSVARGAATDEVNTASDGRPASVSDSIQHYGQVMAKIWHSDNNTMWYVVSTSSHFGRGEQHGEKALRIYLGSPEYQSSSHLAHVLMLLDKSITAFKASELVAEFPSKRLLSAYICKNEIPVLVEDFVQHFKFPRSRAPQAVSAIRNFFQRSDEVGRISRLCSMLEDTVDGGIFQLYRNSILNDARAFQEHVGQKIQSQSGLKQTADEIVWSEYSNSLLSLKKQGSEQYRISKMGSDNLRLARNQAHAFDTTERRIRVQVLSFAQDPVGTQHVVDPLTHQYSSDVPSSMRFSWWERLSQLEKLFVQSQTVYFREMEQLLNDFVSVGTRRAHTVVSEMFLEECRKTIPTTFCRPIDGRSTSGITGRGSLAGSDSVRRVYYADGLYFEVCVDEDGCFNGNDELAAKQASKEVLGAQLVHSSGIAKLVAPLTMCVDFFGYRVLVTCKLPIHQMQLNDDGVIQNETQEVVHHMQKNGRFFVNQSRVAHSYMKILAQRLNLGEHLAKGTDDLSSTSTFASNLKIYKGEDSQFFLRNCRHLLPREQPTATPHLPETPRQHSVLWRFIRPELFRSMEFSLSTDAGLLSTFGVSDAIPGASESEKDDGLDADLKKTYQGRALLATGKELLSTIVPQFLRRILQAEKDFLSIPWKQFTMTQEMHKAGINVRHLGYMRSFLWRDLPGKFSVFHNEKILRSTEYVDEEIFSGDYIQLSKADVSTLDEQEQRQDVNNRARTLHLFEIGDMSMRKNRRFLPITALYTGDSAFNLRGRVGKLMEARTRHDVELLIIGEMVIRTMKQLIRYCWRLYLGKHRVVSPHFQRESVCFHLNVLCATEEGAGAYGSEILYNAVRERFGRLALYPSERTQVLDRLRPAAKLLIPRLCQMIGVTLKPLSLSNFLNNPEGFVFRPNDIMDVKETLKTSFPQLPLLRATNLTLLGDEVLAKTYSALVAGDQPVAFYKLSERKGATAAQNSGLLGASYGGKVSEGCLISEDGPVIGEKFIRSYGFSPIAESMVDFPFHKQIVPVDAQEPFSVEVFFNILGGRDVSRTVVDSGRYQLSISRDNKITIVIFESLHSVNLTLDAIPVAERQWYHLCIAFDGINLTVYVNGQEALVIDMVDAFAMKQRQFDDEHMAALQNLADEEEVEKSGLMESLQEQATSFFATKEGQRMLKDMAQQFLDSEEANDDDPNANRDDDGDHARLMRERKANATKAAKELYLSQQHESAVRALHERFKQMRLDLEDRKTRALDQGKLHSYQHLRVGASLPDANNRHGSAYFAGLISCVSVFAAALPREKVRAHYIASKRDCRNDAFRIFADAVSSFAAAWKNFNGDIDAPHVLDYLSVYSHALCQLFHAQYEEKVEVDRTIAKANLIQLIEVFRVNMMASAIAEIIRHLPREPEFADVVIEALMAIKQTDKNYLFAQGIVQDPKIIMIPFDFALVTPAPRSLRALQASAFLLQQVARDRKLAFAYSDAVDLHWIVELYSPAAVVSVALTAYEDGQFKVLKLKHAELIERWQLEAIAQKQEELQKRAGENIVVYKDNPAATTGTSAPLFSFHTLTASHMESSVAGNKRLPPPPSSSLLVIDGGDKEQEMSLLSDADIQTLAEHLPLLQGIDLSYCGRGLTETAIGELSRFAQLRILVLDSCSDVITDSALVRLQGLAAQLEVLSLSDLPLITDDGVLKAFTGCNRLGTLCLSGSVQVSSRAIVRLLVQNGYLTTLSIARLPLTDRCLVNFADALASAGATLHHLDMSFSADITDSGLLGFLSPSAATTTSSSAASLAVAKLKTMNLQSCQRLSWRSIARVVHCCWQLERLDIDDVYLVRDNSFVFDNKVDGRAQTQEEMMRQLRHISVATCHDVTDVCLKALSAHCRQLQSLCLRDTGKFSDVGLTYLCDPQLCPYSDRPLAATLTDLNLAYAGRFSPSGLVRLLEQTPKLSRLDVSGLATIVDDRLIGHLVHVCPGVQSLGLAQCLQLTDLALCHLAEHLWIEELNLEGCHHISDNGIEVIAEACSGLRQLNVKKARMITERSLRFVESICRNLESLSSDILK